MDNNSIRIDRYLQNEMSTAERLAFENQLSTDPALQEAFRIQQLIIKAAETAGLKHEFGRQLNKQILTARLIRWGIAITLVVAVAVLFAIKNDLFINHTASAEIPGNFQPVEKFDINNQSDTIIETRDGVVFAIPAYAFGEGNNIRLEIKTALNMYDIMQHGLSTMSGDDMLQTAGMFCLNAFSHGKPVPLIKSINVSVPADTINPAMQLFDGVEDSSGRINWVNPRPVEKNLRTYDITTLDFYPPKYIPALKALQKNYRDKRYTDSLYYSFSGWPHSAMPTDTTRAVNTHDYPLSENIMYDHITVSDSISPRYETAIYEIDPARIKAIWNKQFNNTIIATKEFEERLRYMHGICLPYVEAYIQNLKQPLYKTDQLIADNSSGEVKRKFLEFAARKDGAVMVTDALQIKLSNYFQQRSKAYREAAERTWARYWADLKDLDNLAREKAIEQAGKEMARQVRAFEEEFCSNLTEAYKQIGIHRNCNDTIIPPSEKYYNVTITTTGWKNLDVYVFDATKDRQSMTYTDPVTGKVARLVYTEVNIRIIDETTFDRVLVYLVPDSLSSFQLVQKQGGGYTENLNSLFRYDVVVLAWKGTQAYLYRQTNLRQKEYSFTLLPVSDAGVKAELKKYTLHKAVQLKTEFEYRLFEQKEMLRQIRVQQDMQFREQVASSIFNCEAATAKK